MTAAQLSALMAAIGHDRMCPQYNHVAPFSLCTCDLAGKARAARALVLEEAAGICERHAKGACGGAGYYLAKKIRATIPRAPETGKP